MQLLDFKETDVKSTITTELQWFQRMHAIQHVELKGNVFEPDSSPAPIPVEFRLFTCKTVIKNKIMFAAVCQRKDNLNFKDWTEIDVIENLKTEDEAKNILESWTAYLAGSFVSDSLQTNPPKYPPIPEEDGITGEWIEEVLKIDPTVSLEVTVFDRQAGYHILYSKPEFPFPLATSTFGSIPALEEHIQSGALESMTWDPASVRYAPKAAQMRYIYHKKYSRDELASYDIENLRKIARIKQISADAQQIDIFQEILKTS